MLGSVTSVVVDVVVCDCHGIVEDVVIVVVVAVVRIADVVDAEVVTVLENVVDCLLYTSPSPRDS